MGQPPQKMGHQPNISVLNPNLNQMNNGLQN
jgi:hypothetical protein